MKKIKNFKLFLEFNTMSVEDMLDEYRPIHSFLDYEVDSDDENTWITFNLEDSVYKDVIDMMNIHYDSFEEDFKIWCGDNDLICDQILSNDEDKSITYSTIKDKAAFRR